ncbi:hypothetical protein GCM10007276_26190 [Agaricicola taiwanensis]|uniref:Hpt domain-containing protein n=1 Tax=Agaricicola taiwanensis TaxID=591372 RepID=A0A8J2YJI3_9RHOB|nr:hypothetical protein GCM10007276_26190 [Agaricicola taiwanensis]
MPPTDLRAFAKYIPGEGLDEAALERAEQALQALEGNFGAWMQHEVDALVTEREALRLPVASARAFDPFYRASHDLRGQAATFGYPVAGEIADNLCNYMDAVSLPDGISMEFVDAHINAIVAVLREDVRDSSNPIARALLWELGEARKRFAPSPADGDDAEASGQA